jgi:hypothetical protein
MPAPLSRRWQFTLDACIDLGLIAWGESVRYALVCVKRDNTVEGYVEYVSPHRRMAATIACIGCADVVAAQWEPSSDPRVAIKADMLSTASVVSEHGVWSEAATRTTAKHSNNARASSDVSTLLPANSLTLTSIPPSDNNDNDVTSYMLALFSKASSSTLAEFVLKPCVSVVEGIVELMWFNPDLPSQLCRAPTASWETLLSIMWVYELIVDIVHNRRILSPLQRAAAKRFTAVVKGGKVETICVDAPIFALIGDAGRMVKAGADKYKFDPRSMVKDLANEMVEADALFRKRGARSGQVWVR